MSICQGILILLTLVATGSGSALEMPDSAANNYAITSKDCGQTISMTGPLDSISLPSSVSGFPQKCVVTVKNNNPTRAQRLIGFPVDFVGNRENPGCGSACLWPLQAVQVGIFDGTWSTIIYPGRWRILSARFYVDNIGSDSNDCLATGKSACKTIQQAINLACNQTDSHQPNVKVAHGSYAGFELVEDCVGANQIKVTGDPQNPSTVQLVDKVGWIDVYAKDKGILTINGFTIASRVVGTQGIECGQNSVVDVSNVIFTNMPGGTHVLAIDNCQVNLNEGISLIDAGGKVGSKVHVFLAAQQFGRIQLNTNVGITGNWQVTDGCQAVNSGLININAHTITGGKVSGRRFLAQTGAGIVGGASRCPGDQQGLTNPPGYSN